MRGGAVDASAAMSTRLCFWSYLKNENIRG